LGLAPAVICDPPVIGLQCTAGKSIDSDRPIVSTSSTRGDDVPTTRFSSTPKFCDSPAEATCE